MAASTCPASLLAAWRAGTPERVRWIVKDNIGLPDWARGSDLPEAAVPFRTTTADAQVAAVREGLGMATLPCFVGDVDPLLARVPGTGLRMHGTLWLLTQGETRKTKRVRLFIDLRVRTAGGPCAAARGTGRPAGLTRRPRRRCENAQPV